MWGFKVFEGAGGHPYDPGEWKSRLQKAQKSTTKSQSKRFAGSGPDFVTAICVRDHFDELSMQESNWCVERVCGAIEQSLADFETCYELSHQHRYGLRVGSILHDLGRFDEALATYDNVLAHVPVDDPYRPFIIERRARSEHH